MRVTCPHCGGDFSVSDQRSDAEHSNYMSLIEFCFLHLPEHRRMDFANADALRWKALVATGWSTHELFVDAATLAEARRFASWHRSPRCFPVVDVQTKAVTLFYPRSQSYAAMGKKDFRKSSAAVIDWIGREVLGVDPHTLRDEGLNYRYA